MKWLVSPCENAGTDQRNDICVIVVCCSNACYVNCGVWCSMDCRWIVLP